MPYTITQTHQYLHVAEQQYAIAKKVRFTTLDSCIGVAGRRNNGRVVGVHLVVVGAQGPFDEAAANVVADLVQDCDEVMIVGAYTIWQDSVGAAFDVLTERLNPTLVYADGVPSLQFRVSHGRLRYKLNASRWCSCLGV
ncbi:MAG: hypothetical protein K0V04_45625 [Deltaproteobacteria bacterium]|nr:hypothetical protein [Deltaproteobacteria bacterium]